MADILNFTVYAEAAPVPPNGLLVGVRVQNLSTGEWFNWNKLSTTEPGVWDANGEPHVIAGTQVYIAAYAQNKGDAGNLTLKILSGPTVLAQKTENVASNASFGLEMPSLTITGHTSITVRVDP